MAKKKKYNKTNRHKRQNQPHQQDRQNQPDQQYQPEPTDFFIQKNNGIILNILAHPNAKSNGIYFDEIQSGKVLRIDIAEAPIKGKANIAIIKLIAQSFSIPKSNIQIISGNTSNSKKVLILCKNDEEIKELLEKITKGYKQI